MKVLVESGRVDINATRLGKGTALHEALIMKRRPDDEDSQKVIQYLLDSGIDCNVEFKWLHSAPRCTD